MRQHIWAIGRDYPGEEPWIIIDSQPDVTDLGPFRSRDEARRRCAELNDDESCWEGTSLKIKYRVIKLVKSDR